MVFAALVAVLVTMVLVLVRALLGRSLYDRVLAVNNFGTKMVLFVALAGFASGRPAFLDIALAYSLFNFVGTIAVLRLSHYGELGFGPEAGDHL